MADVPVISWTPTSVGLIVWATVIPLVASIIAPAIIIMRFISFTLTVDLDGYPTPRARYRFRPSRLASARRPGYSPRKPRRHAGGSERVQDEHLMGFRCGIVGLPNVGKSTLFNALTETAAAQAANYPFCTIEPNVGQVAVPDPRLDTIAKIGGSAKIIETQLGFVDIAGLVRGASKGEGLGNQFLANIREVDAIVHVLRCFEDGDVTHVEGKVDPIADAETVETELMLSDLESLEKRVPAAQKKATQGDKEAKVAASVLGQALDLLREGKPARLTVPKDEDEARVFAQAQLLTSKPVLYVCNVDEAAAADGNELSARVAVKAAAEGAKSVVVSAAIEAEIATMAPADRVEFLSDLGLTETGLARVIRAGYDLLHLLTFFTVGPKEARAWTIERGSKAPQAAGAIHTDFERGFIRAETMAYDDYVALGGEAAARDAGKLRSEGKEYVVADGDILLFRFNV
ncbi:ribosome-binding ATPase YchF [Sphingomonas prati]|nr:ribosome-binding ATPase YchF [Sphingomonas prati]